MIEDEDMEVLALISEARKAMEQSWTKGKVSGFRDGINPDLTPLMVNLRMMVAVRKDTGGPSWVEIISRDLLKVATQTDGERLERDLIALCGSLLAWLQQKRRQRERAVNKLPTTGNK